MCIVQVLTRQTISIYGYQTKISSRGIVVSYIPRQLLSNQTSYMGRSNKKIEGNSINRLDDVQQQQRSILKTQKPISSENIENESLIISVRHTSE
jgi:hypothetical protein